MQHSFWQATLCILTLSGLSNAYAEVPLPQPRAFVMDQPLRALGLSGKSFVPMLLGKTTNYNKRSLIWHFPNLWGNDGPGIGTTSAIRKGDYKLVYYYETGKRELFNITNDIGETRDLAASNPQLVKKLSKE